MKLLNTIKYTLIIFSLIAVLSIFAKSDAIAKEIDWEKIKPTTVTMFYPGMTSMEFLISDDHRLGGRNIKKGKKNCRRCHLSKKGELDLNADEIASGTAKMKRSRKPFEDEPLKGKGGTLIVNVKAAYDSEYIYLRLSWPSSGRGWAGTGEGTIKPDRVSLQLNKRDDYFRRYGCFITCHNDLNTMPDSPAKKLVGANPYYSELKRDDVRLYAYYTRMGSWDKIKSTDELSTILREGGLMDLWSVKLRNRTSAAKDGWVFEDRRWERESDLTAHAIWNAEAGGKYIVDLKRKLATKSVTDIQLKEGNLISVGIAIHDDNAEKRRHYVSFPTTVSLGAEAEADIAAKKLR
jgi:cytochrome c-type protein NapC